MGDFFRFYFLLLTGILFLGCASTKSGQTEGAEKRNVSRSTYTTSYPSRDVSDQLKNIRRSIKRISSSGIFVTYYIEDRLLTREELKNVNIADIASNFVTNTESTAGTAISIFSNDRRVALLTNAHVVHFPDTLYTYIEESGLPENTYISAVKIKKDQNNLIYDLPNIGSFDIIGMDSNSDLALIRVNRTRFSSLEAPALSINAGESSRLQWGSFIYIMGYPQGYPMVTRGIVSDPNRSADGDYLTDALFNRGISGGIILATRNDFKTLEWVGMTHTATATSSSYLVPDLTRTNEYRPFVPYTDSVFIEEKTQISYGITQAIPIQKIRNFLQDHSRRLRRMGFGNQDLFPLTGQSN